MGDFKQGKNVWHREDLLLGHVQQSNGVPLTVQICPDCVEHFVKLPLNICELFKYFIGWPHKDLKVDIKKKQLGGKIHYENIEL